MTRLAVEFVVYAPLDYASQRTRQHGRFAYVTNRCAQRRKYG